MATLVIGIVLDSGRKQGVDKRGFSQSRFSSNLYSKSAYSFILADWLETDHDSESRTPLSDNFVSV